jgi:hypothetical protein
MFYETRVLDAHGNLKKTISAQELHTRHWKIFQKMEERTLFQPKKITPKPEIKMQKKKKSFNMEHLQQAS